jgi:hypothetical protein
LLILVLLTLSAYMCQVSLRHTRKRVIDELYWLLTVNV